MTLVELRAWLAPFVRVGALVPASEILVRLPGSDGETPAPVTPAEVPLTCKQISELLGRTPACVRSWCLSGVLPAYRLCNREWRVKPEDLAKFLAGARYPRPTGSEAASRPLPKRSGLGSWRNA